MSNDFRLWCVWCIYVCVGVCDFYAGIYASHTDSQWPKQGKEMKDRKRMENGEKGEDIKRIIIKAKNSELSLILC